MATRKSLRRGIQVALASLAVGLLSRCPPAVARRLGSGLGTLARLLSPGVTRTMRAHLDASWGTALSPRALHHIARRVLPSLVATICESVSIARRGVDATLARTPIDGLEAFEARVRAGPRGVIVVGAHYGHWELLGGILARAKGGDALCIARRYEVEGYERIVGALRQGLGVRTLAQEDSLLPVIRTLRRGGALGLLPDQDFKNLADGVFVDFLGRPAYTTIAPAELSLRTGAPIVVATLRREGARMVLESGAPIEPSRFASHAEPARAITECWSRELSDHIRRGPHLWVWMHRRWRTTPERLHYRSLRRKEREEKRRRLAAEAPSPP